MTVSYLILQTTKDEEDMQVNRVTPHRGGIYNHIILKTITQFLVFYDRVSGVRY
jgi:hypothetical protein